MVTAAEFNTWYHGEYPEGHDYEGSTRDEEGPQELFDTWRSDPQPVETPWGPAVSVEDFGGEGQGDHAHVVVKLGDQYFKIDGYYSSWEGTDWSYDEWYEAKPVEKTVIEYEKV